MNRANWSVKDANGKIIDQFSPAVREIFHDGPNARISGRWYKYHDFSEVNGVTHACYNEKIRVLLEAFMKKNDIPSLRAMTPAQATDFLRDVVRSKDPTIVNFNAGVTAERDAAEAAGAATYAAANKGTMKARQKAWDKSKKAASDAVDAMRDKLNKEAAERAAKELEEAAAKQLANKGGKKIVGRIVHRSAKCVGGAMAGYAGYEYMRETGDANGAIREGLIQATPIGLTVDAGRAVADGITAAEDWSHANAQKQKKSSKLGFGPAYSLEGE